MEDVTQGMPVAEYFGAVGKDKLPGMLEVVEDNWREALEAYNLPGTWYLVWCQAFGVDPKTWHQTGVQYVGAELDTLRFRTNLSRPNVRQSIMLALGERPSFQAVAINNDVAALAQVPAVTKLVEYSLKEAQIDKHGYGAVEADRWFGKGYLWVTWDAAGGENVPGEVMATDEAGEPVMWEPPEPGGEPQPVMQRGDVPSGTVKIRRLFPWQVVCEAHAETPTWYVVKEPISKWELAAQYPELADQILQVDNVEDVKDREMFAFQTSCATQDVVILRHFYHVPCKAVPGGRHAAYVDDVVLWDRKCPVVDRMPIVEVCTMRYFGLSLGYPEVSDIVSQNEVLDDVLSQVVNNLMKFGNESLWAEDGVDFDRDQIAEGGGFFTLGRGQKPPQAIQWAQMPEIAKFLLEFVPGLMQQVAGLNATALGKPEGNVQSGTAMALMVNVAERYQHATQAAYDQALYEVANLALEFIRSNADNGYAAQVTGVGEQPVMRFFQASELKGVRRIQIERRNPLMSTFPVRLDVMNAIRELPRDQMRAAAELLLTGNVDSFTEDPFTQTLLIRWENEECLAGRTPPVMASDDHKIHNPKHRSVLDKLRAQPPGETPEAEAQRQAAIGACLQHMMAHAGEWLKLDPVMGLTLGIPPAQAMMMGGAPTAAGGGGGGGGGAPKLGAPAQQPEQSKLPQPASQPAAANLKP